MYLLVKFNKEPIHTDNLHANGDIWFSKISDWTPDKEKGDKFETIVSCQDIQPESILSLLVNEKESKIRINKGQILSTVIDIGYASSFYLLDLRKHNIDTQFRFPDEMRKYGETCVMIFDPAKFIDNCKRYFGLINIPLFYQKINYNLPLNFKNKNVFIKKADFEIENEFRFYIPKEKLNNQLFSIGSIQSFSKVLPFSASMKFAPRNLYPDIEPTMYG